MTLTDCWKAFKHAMPLKKDKEITIKDFADCMAMDCLVNDYTTAASSVNGFIATEDDVAVPRTIGTGNGIPDDLSTVTTPTALASEASVVASHMFKDNPELEEYADGKFRPMRRRCPACSAILKKRNPTSKTCFHPACRQRRYWVAGRYLYGVFYCPEHYQVHYQAILQGEGNV
jgi:hypothetical protein